MLEKEPKDPTSYPHCYASLRADLLGGSTFLHSPKPAVTSKWRMTVPRLGKNTAFSMEPAPPIPISSETYG